MKIAPRFQFVSVVLPFLILSALPATAAKPERGWGSSWTQARTPSEAAASQLLKRSLVEIKAGKYQAALASVSETLKLYPNSAGVFWWRAGIYAAMGQHQRALDDCNRGLEIAKSAPRAASVVILRRRAEVYYWMGNFRAARGDLETALDYNKEDALSYNALAWFLATCPDAACRDGKRAVTYARIANEKSGNKVPGIMDTLAAAEAEAGAFSVAVEHQQLAMKLGPHYQWDGFAKRRLELYQRQQPYREQRTAAEQLFDVRSKTQ